MTDIQNCKETHFAENFGMSSEFYVPLCKLRALSELFYGDGEGIHVSFTEHEWAGLSFILKEIADEVASIDNEVTSLIQKFQIRK